MAAVRPVPSLFCHCFVVSTDVHTSWLWDLAVTHAAVVYGGPRSINNVTSEKAAVQAALDDKVRMMGRYREAIEKLKNDNAALQVAAARATSTSPDTVVISPSNADGNAVFKGLWAVPVPRL